MTTTSVPATGDPGLAGGVAHPGVGGQVVPAGRRVRLGEELPIFCEKCGYSLHGLPQQRCDRCTVLQYKCPECGHHQPINTLRPAAQRILGRIRAFFLACWVFFKFNFFGWLLFAWFGMGVEWSYRFESRQIPVVAPATAPAVAFAGAPGGAVPVAPAPPPPPITWAYSLVPRPVDVEACVAFVCFALAFGAVGRMLLLRWRRGWAVGAVLALLVLAAVLTGAWCRANLESNNITVTGPPASDFHLLSLGGAATLVFGAVVVWPVWLALTHLFLPAKTAAALVEWQRSLSGREREPAREPALGAP